MLKQLINEQRNHGRRLKAVVLLLHLCTSQKNKQGAKFAFPADLVHDNLASLLGLLQTPWTTTTADSQDANDATKAKKKGGVGAILHINSAILRELGVTPEMCQSYVEYCRTGRTSSDAMTFMVRAAAPQDLFEQYTFRVSKHRVTYDIIYHVNYLGSKCYDRKQDTVGFFSEWNASGREGCIAIEATHGSHYVILHNTNDSIEALRQRIRKNIWKLENVRNALEQHGTPMREVIVSCMRDQVLPFYRVNLLSESENE